MRIGEFSEKCQASKDTIRFYVKEGLLVPGTDGAQMDFTERELEDYKYIKSLRDIEFSIREIYQVLAIRRTVNMVEPCAAQDYVQMLREKKQVLEQRIVQLEQSVGSLDSEILRWELPRAGQHSRLGVSLSALQYLHCPHCNKPLLLENANLSSRYIFDGHLNCDCGYGIDIVDGIVETGNLYLDDDDSPDEHFSGLYDGVSEGFVTYLQKSYDFITKHLCSMDLKNKVVLEANLEGYFYLYTHFDKLEKDCTYILIDKFPQTLRHYKEMIEKLNCNLNILFLADASTNYPLKKNSIDVFINCFGDDEYLLYHENAYLTDILPFFKKDCAAVGGIMAFDADSRSLANVKSCYPKASSSAFTQDGVLHSYAQAGFTLTHRILGVLTRTYNKFRYRCHEDDEALTIMTYFAQKSSTVP